MVRPRLVEEGVPLPGWGDSISESGSKHSGMEDQTMMEASRTKTHTSMNPVAQKQAPATSSSSLLRALGGKLPASNQSMMHKSSKRSMRFEIGHDDTGDPDAMEQDDSDASDGGG